MLVLGIVGIISVSMIFSLYCVVSVSSHSEEMIMQAEAKAFAERG